LPKSLPNRIRFTDLAISRLKEPGIYWDALLPRFGCRVSPSSKVWLVALGNSKKRFGRFPELGVAEARAKAREIMADPDAVEAPQQATEELSGNTFGALADAFLAHSRTKRGRPLRANTVRQYRLGLLSYAAPLHRQLIGDITRQQVAAVIDQVARTSGTTSGMHCRAALSRFLGWCVARGHADFNVVTGTEGYSIAKRSRVLSDGELASLWASTEEPHVFNIIVRICLWTGCRRSEAGGMCWSELVDGTWIVSGERTKNHRPLVLPLPRQAVEALARWPRVLGKDTMFGRGNGFQGWYAAKRRLDARLGFAQDWDLHDIRRSVQTRMVGLGLNRDVVSRLLNHAMGPIDEAYDHHSYLPEKAAALQKWADKLEEIVATSNFTLVTYPQRC
jgi:integrase